jgi:hypothetical protein
MGQCCRKPKVKTSEIQLISQNQAENNDLIPGDNRETFNDVLNQSEHIQNNVLIGSVSDKSLNQEKDTTSYHTSILTVCN